MIPALGVVAVAFLAFGLSYHEPGAPRLAWFILLLPLALLRVVPQGGARKWIAVARYLGIAWLVVCLVPFVALQIQGVIYPQLERQDFSYGSRPLFGRPAFHPGPPLAAPAAGGLDVQEGVAGKVAEAPARGVAEGWSSTLGRAARYQLESNLRYESKAKIQTGPAEPEWSWNSVSCGWNGPVYAGEKIRPNLVSLTMHRFLTVLRGALLLWLRVAPLVGG